MLRTWQIEKYELRPLGNEFKRRIKTALAGGPLECIARMRAPSCCYPHPRKDPYVNWTTGSTFSSLRFSSLRFSSLPLSSLQPSSFLPLDFTPFQRL